MNLRHLSVFHGIAKTGSVNAAAKLLHTSQPAVSRELRTLEGRLGVLLFDRLPRGMRLTEAGMVLLDRRGNRLWPRLPRNRAPRGSWVLLMSRLERAYLETEAAGSAFRAPLVHSFTSTAGTPLPWCWMG